MWWLDYISHGQLGSRVLQQSEHVVSVTPYLSLLGERLEELHVANP